MLLAAFTLPMTTDAFRGAISNMLTWKPAYTVPAAAPATHIQQITASGFLKYPAIKMNRPAVSAPARKKEKKIFSHHKFRSRRTHFKKKKFGVINYGQ